MDVVEIECGDEGWIQMAQFRVEWPPVVETVINLKVPCKTVTISISRMSALGGVN
jgi:hypothetical protein